MRWPGLMAYREVHMTLARRVVRDYFSPWEVIDTSPRISDEVKSTTCYMCACRCGINVHLKAATFRCIEGNRDHPVNRGVICGKGSSGIMQHDSPARSKAAHAASASGEGGFSRIEWEEALRPRSSGWHRSAPSGRERSSPFSPAAIRASPSPAGGRSSSGPQLRRAWRLLLRQYGGRRPVHARAAASGSSAIPIGTHPNSS